MTKMTWRLSMLMIYERTRRRTHDKKKTSQTFFPPHFSFRFMLDRGIPARFTNAVKCECDDDCPCLSEIRTYMRDAMPDAKHSTRYVARCGGTGTGGQMREDEGRDFQPGLQMLQQLKNQKLHIVMHTASACSASMTPGASDPQLKSLLAITIWS
jgi:hypothetical protein